MTATTTPTSELSHHRANQFRLLLAVGFSPPSAGRILGTARQDSRSRISTFLERFPSTTIEERISSLDPESPDDRFVANLLGLTLTLLRTPIPPPLRPFLNLNLVNTTRAKRAADHARSNGHDFLYVANEDLVNDALATASYYAVMELAPSLLPTHPNPVGPLTVVPPDSPFNRIRTGSQGGSRTRRVARTNFPPGADDQPPALDDPPASREAAVETRTTAEKEARARRSKAKAERASRKQSRRKSGRVAARTTPPDAPS